jgi:hypothetical protein
LTNNVVTCTDLPEDAPLPGDLSVGKKPYDSFKG